MIETHRCEVATRVPEHIQSTPDTCTRTCQVSELQVCERQQSGDVGQSRLAFFIVVTLMQAFKCTITCTSTARCLQTLLVLEVDIVRNHNSKTFHLSFRHVATTSRTGHIHSKAPLPTHQNGLHQHRRHRRTRQRPRRATRSPPNHDDRRHETQPISIPSPLCGPPSPRRRYHCPLLVRTHDQACGTLYAGLCV